MAPLKVLSWTGTKTRNRKICKWNTVKGKKKKRGRGSACPLPWKTTETDAMKNLKLLIQCGVLHVSWNNGCGVPNSLSAFKITSWWSILWVILFTVEVLWQLPGASSFFQSATIPWHSIVSVFGPQTLIYSPLVIPSTKCIFQAQVSAQYPFWKWGVTTRFHKQTLKYP